MSMRRFRRKAQQVSHSAKPFIDSADSIADPFSIAGATIPSLRLAVPRDGVLRLLELDDDRSDSPYLRFMSGYGADKPHVASRIRPWPVVRVSAARRSPVTPLIAQRRKASRLALYEVRVQAPSREQFCVRRHVRKSVLFARGVAGHRRRSPGLGGSYKRVWSSAWGC